jgi:co-chaperonin GroES (HSP10)
MEWSQIKPVNQRVLVEVLPFENKTDSGIILVGEKKASKLQNENYIGQVLKIAEDCPLEKIGDLQEGDYVIFSQFAGMHIPDENKFVKMVDPYMLVVKSKDKSLPYNEWQPLDNRVLVKVVEGESKTEGGLIVKKMKDPRQADSQMGIVISAGVLKSKGIKVGDKVAFDPFCGNIIHEEIPTIEATDGLQQTIFYKTVYDFDIEFVIE